MGIAQGNHILLPATCLLQDMYSTNSTNPNNRPLGNLTTTSTNTAVAFDVTSPPKHTKLMHAWQAVSLGAIHLYGFPKKGILKIMRPENIGCLKNSALKIIRCPEDIGCLKNGALKIMCPKDIGCPKKGILKIIRCPEDHSMF